MLTSAIYASPAEDKNSINENQSNLSDMAKGSFWSQYGGDNSAAKVDYGFLSIQILETDASDADHSKIWLAKRLIN